jgi:hypothetical protein
MCTFGQLVNLAEGTAHIVLPTGDEDAASNNGVLRLALEDFCIVDDLVKKFCCFGDCFGNLERLAEGGDLTVSSRQCFICFIVVVFVLLS